MFSATSDPDRLHDIQRTPGRKLPGVFLACNKPTPDELNLEIVLQTISSMYSAYALARHRQRPASPQAPAASQCCRGVLSLPRLDRVQPLLQHPAPLASTLARFGEIDVSEEPNPISRASAFPALLACPLNGYTE